jgi:enediyne biosynthesis protein E4
MRSMRALGWSAALAAAAGALAWFGWASFHSPPRPDEGPAGPPWFEDVTEASGLRFVHDAGPIDGQYFMPQLMGSGAALFDFDGDGILDAYLLHNGGPGGAKNRLYHGLPGGRFEDVSAGSGLDFAGHCMGVAVGDVNNDGLPDVLVTEYRGVRLFLNRGGGKFTDVTKEAGLSNPDWGVSAAFFDYDRDGWLDLVVVNYVDYKPGPCDTPRGPDYCPPARYRGTVTRLFHNLGPGPAVTVRFEDVTEKSGLGKVLGPGLGVVCADFDGDGWPDIFVANDGEPNRLWVNRRDGTFREEAMQRGAALNVRGQSEAGMGVALGDVNGDGLFDLFVTHTTEETHTLWVQGPRGVFQDRTGGLGLANSRWRGTGFGTVMADFDQDGALDIAFVNGRITRGPTVTPEMGPHWGPYGDRNQLFANKGDGHFRDISPQNAAFCGVPNVARGLAWGDIDGDGAVDLLVTTVAGPARLYRNVAPRRGHWLLVRAFDPALRRDAVGAEVRVRAGGKTYLRLITAAGSYLCSGDMRAHFGLGPAERFEGIEVAWPDGTKETFGGGPADRAIQLEKGKGRTEEEKRP